MVTKVRTTLHSGQQWTGAFIRVKVKVVPRNYKKKKNKMVFVSTKNVANFEAFC